jgi:hypothetical protein
MDVIVGKSSKSLARSAWIRHSSKLGIQSIPTIVVGILLSTVRAGLFVVGLIRWHRRGFRLFWRWKSKPAGRPALPKNLQELIRKMAADNPTRGEEHVANELKLKLGIRVSPRTVRLSAIRA